MTSFDSNGRVKELCSPVKNVQFVLVSSSEQNSCAKKLKDIDHGNRVYAGGEIFLVDLSSFITPKTKSSRQNFV